MRSFPAAESRKRPDIEKVEKMTSKTDALYALAFLAIVVCSLDFWNWHRKEPMLCGLPYWLVSFFALHFVVCAYYYLFSKRFWRA